MKDQLKKILTKLKIKHGVILVGLALVLFVWWGSSKADQLYIDIGPSQVGSNWSTGVMLQLNNRITNHIDLGFGYISPQSFNTCGAARCEWEVDAQLYAGVEFGVSDPWAQRARIAFGPYYFQNADRIGTSRFRAGVSLEYRISNRIGFKARHFSTAGSSPEIMACNVIGTCLVNDWNTGQDSWARLVWYF